MGEKQFQTPVQTKQEPDQTKPVSAFPFGNSTNNSLKQTGGGHNRNKTECSAFKGSENGSAKKTLNMRDFKRFKFLRNI